MSKPIAVPARPACYQRSQVTSAAARCSLARSHRYGPVLSRLGHGHGHTPAPSPCEGPRSARLTRVQQSRGGGMGPAVGAHVCRSAVRPDGGWSTAPPPTSAAGYCWSRPRVAREYRCGPRREPGPGQRRSSRAASLDVVALVPAAIGSQLLARRLGPDPADPYPPRIRVSRLHGAACVYGLTAWPVLWAVCEEGTYLGYAFPRLERRYGTGRSAALVSLAWAAQHAVMPVLPGAATPCPVWPCYRCRPRSPRST